MSDGDMKFPPGKRRESPKFEPPPWEREQFDELAKAREARQAEAPGDALSEDGNDRHQEHAGTTGEVVPQAEETQVGANGSSSDEASSPAKLGPAPGKAVQLDEEQVALLLSGLRAEEPRAAEGYWKLSMVTGIILTIVGLAVTTWGVVAFLTPKETGATGNVLVTGLLVPGLGFLAGGVWLVINSLRRQGVL